MINYVKARCIEVECPHWGWIKIPFEKVNVYWWQDWIGSDIEMTFECPACGEKHEIIHN